MFPDNKCLPDRDEATWDYLETVLDSVLLLPENQRQNYIKEECKSNESLKNELLDLLKAIEDSEGFLSRGKEIKESMMMQFSGKNPEQLTGDLYKGKLIGNYRLCDLIGYGGMGSVYLAERHDGLYDQKVAVKLIRQGMDTPENIARFERERFILAGLNHPNIARLYDGGVTGQGLPYLVMEYVDGVPIDIYCDENNLSIHDRINLFKAICNTVQYAHNNLVIHRDLKPANILVNKEGEVKILDFGIAKILKNEEDLNLIQTCHSRQIMTPGYAAPEQVLNKSITTTTDIYTLGTLLYSLLSGTPALEMENLSLLEKQKVIAEQQAKKPSEKYYRLEKNKQKEIARLRSTTPAKLKHSLKPDLDAIILKSIRKEPQNRYQTARNFVEDLENYQQNLPVQAHEGNFKYYCLRYFKRNYKLLSAVAILLITVCAFSLYHSSKISAERNQAQTEAKKAAQVTSLLFDLFEAGDPAESAGDTITAKQLLERGLSRADMLKEQPEIQARMLSIIGQIHHRLGNYEESRPLLEQTLTLYTDLYGEQHTETAGSMGHLGRLLSSLGEYQQAEFMLNKSLDILENSSKSKQPDIAAVKNDLAYAMRRQGNYDEAESLFKSSYEIFKTNYGSDYIHTLNSQSSLGTIYFNKGQYEKAQEIYGEVLEKRKRLLGDSHPLVGESKNSLAALYMNRGRFAEAEELFSEALEIRRLALGDNHPKVALTLNNSAINFREQGQFEKSEILFEEAIDLRKEQFGEHHISTATSYLSLGELMLMKNQPDSALVLFNRVLPVFQETLADNHSFTARTKMFIGYTYLKLGHHGTAGKYLFDGYNRVKEIHPEGSLERALADHQLGLYHLNSGNELQADSLITSAGSAMQDLEMNKSLRHQIILNDLAKLKNRDSLVQNELP